MKCMVIIILTLKIDALAWFKYFQLGVLASMPTESFVPNFGQENHEWGFREWYEFKLFAVTLKMVDVALSSSGIPVCIYSTGHVDFLCNAHTDCNVALANMIHASRDNMVED